MILKLTLLWFVDSLYNKLYNESKQWRMYKKDSRNVYCGLFVT